MALNMLSNLRPFVYLNYQHRTKVLLNDYEVRLEYPFHDLDMQAMFDYGYQFADANPVDDWTLHSVRVKAYPYIG